MVIADYAKSTTWESPGRVLIQEPSPILASNSLNCKQDEACPVLTAYPAKLIYSLKAGARTVALKQKLAQLEQNEVLNRKPKPEI